jgi:hypothetical protein
MVPECAARLLEVPEAIAAEVLAGCPLPHGLLSAGRAAVVTSVLARLRVRLGDRPAAGRWLAERLSAVPTLPSWHDLHRIRASIDHIEVAVMRWYRTEHIDRHEPPRRF